VTTPHELAAYYAARALEYESVYAKPERQADLMQLRTSVETFARDRRVLEVACGTGYWTAVLAKRATWVVATDIGAEVLLIARAKQLPNVAFFQADAMAPLVVPGVFDAAFAGFWWSHLRRDELSRFLEGLHTRVAPSAVVMLVDNRYVEGNSTPIARSDSAGNTYQRRRLSNGDEYEILKNFPAPSDIRDSITACGGTSIEIIELEYYWCATYRSGAT
jgi:SAM-dependent methyltransferase